MIDFYKEKINKELFTDEIINYLEEIYSQVDDTNNYPLSKGNAKSTHNVIKKLYKNPIFNHIMEEITKHIDNYKKIYNYNENLIIKNLWSNMNMKGGYTDIHDHRNINGLAGVVYIEMYNDQMGNFFIIDKDIETEIIVRSYDIILFPSKIQHGTRENLTDFRRLVLGVDIEVV